MSETLKKERRGLSANSLWVIAMCFLAAGVAGRCILENRMLGLTEKTEEELLKLLENPNVMGLASVALVLQVLYYCAVPLFSWLLVEGFRSTGSVRHYALRLLALAVICELPYNLAMDNRLWAAGTRNPVFGLLLGLVLLWFYRTYSRKSLRDFAIRLLVTVMAVLWVGMLRISQGLPLVILVAVIWLLRDKPGFKVIGGCTAAIVCTLFSPLYMLSPMTFIAVHFYNGKREPGNRWVRYGLYPAMLLGAWALAQFL